MVGTFKSRRQCSRMLVSDSEWPCSSSRSVARHEQFHATPPLEIAISYEIIFRIPVAEIFAGLRDQAEIKVESGLIQLEEQLGARTARDRTALSTARKLVWLSERKNLDYAASR